MAEEMTSRILASDAAKPTPPSSFKDAHWFMQWWRIARGFLLKWLAAFGFVAAFSTCPFCGQQGCPGGAASAGILGAVMAAIPTWLGIRRRGSAQCESAEHTSREMTDK